MKRTGIKRKAPSRNREGCGATKEADSEYRAFMDGFRGLPSIMSGKTHCFLKDEKGNPLLTEAHHILPQSIYPKHKMNPENIAVLTRSEHSMAEDHPTEFRRWLQDNHPLRSAWVEENEHHRKNK